MAIQLTWLGHGSWLIKTEKHTLVLDPFLNDSPTASCKADDIEADFVLVSHGHADHISDVASIANRCKSTVITMVEVGGWLEAQQNVENVVGMNLGGGKEFDFGHVKLSPALHSSSLPDGSYGGVPVGFVLTIEGKKIYFACDTALFSDMQLIGNLGLDVAVLPIGDHFTMGIEDSVAATKLLSPKTVLPAHYNTWPPIAQDASVWAKQIEAATSASPVVLEPGQTFELT